MGESAPWQAWPLQACDTHVHVFDPARFAYEAHRTYTPGTARVDALRAHLAQWQLQRVVLVQPSVYGTDNACLLSSLEELGPRARGVVVVPDEGPGEAMLAQMHALGVRGIRLNIEVAGGSAQALRPRLRALHWLRMQAGWSLHWHAPWSLTRDLMADLAALRVPVVLDHFASLHKQADTDPRHWQALLAFMHSGPGWLKVSAPYRRHGAWQTAQWLDLVSASLGVAPNRVIWGSDWPHTGGDPGKPRDPGRIEAFRTVDLARDIQTLAQHLQARHGASAVSRVWKDNPSRLYGFEGQSAPSESSIPSPHGGHPSGHP